jgi:peptide/nickel transport system permease protein
MKNGKLSIVAQDPLALISGSVILCLLAIAILVAITGARLGIPMTSDILQPPSTAYLLGTDELGRSVAVQMIVGTRVSLTIGLCAALAANVIGILVGAISGFAGNAIDTVLMRIAEFFQIMPTFILAAIIVALAGPGEWRVVCVIALLAWPQSARLMRTEVMRVKRLEFIEAARSVGLRESIILTREVMPNAIAPVLAFGTLAIAQAILLEASLSYFGLSAPDTISWGHMLSSGQRFLYQAWWLALCPGVAIFFTVLAFNVFGDRIRDAVSPGRGKSAYY